MDPPRVYMFRWNQDVLRFELIPDGGCCLRRWVCLVDNGFELRFARDPVWTPVGTVWALLVEDSPLEAEPPVRATNEHVPAAGCAGRSSRNRNSACGSS